MISIRSLLLAMLLVNGMQSTGLAQQSWKKPDVTGKVVVVNEGVGIFSSPLAGTAEAQLLEGNWDIRLRKFNSVPHVSSVPQKTLDSLRLNNKLKAGHAQDKTYESVSIDSSLTPTLGRNFRGNQRDNSVPMDNSMAVSRNGFIVSGINSNVIFAGPDGKITYSRGLADFFVLLGLGSRMYDPRVIYDTEQNRFVFMCLHGSEPSNTFLCIAFSKTEDPTGEWFYYKIDGNPSGDNNWFDYPNISLSAQELFVAGLMRNTDGNWQYSVLYQIDKHAAYAGKAISWKYYNDIKDADGQPSFNLVPTPSGWSDLANKSMFFVSNEELGGDKYNLHFTTGSLADNPTLMSIQTQGPGTVLAPYGRQNGTAAVLNTFDSRLWSAMYLNGTIHIGSHVNTPSGDVGLFYGRMDVQSGIVKANVLVVPGKDLAYPSFTAFGDSPDKDEILVNYLISGPDMFPSQQQRVCKGAADLFQWSEPVTLQAGQSQVDFLTGNLERWGDYTTASRRFFGGRTESWVTGCFGESRSYGTWLGQFFPKYDTETKVLAEFIAEKTTERGNQQIQFTDLTPHKPSKWSWSFENGNPATSSETNPTVSWTENGSYDVTLIVETERGIDTIIKENYIHISDPVVKPVADFTQSVDTLYKDDEVSFFDKSSENTVTYKWTFQNGTPAASTDKNPVVKYAKTGSHLVSLTAANIAGTNTRIRQKAVTVLDRTMPTANFIANKTVISPGDTVVFTDLSTGGPTTWDWQFYGGIPVIVSGKTARVVYVNAGKYDVGLKVNNSIGADSLVIKEYISVIPSSVKELGLSGSLSIYPNPVNDSDVKINFTLESAGKCLVEIRHISGELVKNLVDETCKIGEYSLIFNAAMLTPGWYYCLIYVNGKMVGAGKLAKV